MLSVTHLAFGGSAPLLATSMVEQTGNASSSGLYMMLSAGATLLMLLGFSPLTPNATYTGDAVGDQSPFSRAGPRT